MKAFLFSLAALLLAHCCLAQHVYQIRADSVRIYNTCDTAELILENRTQNVSGFLFNKGRGRTEFRQLRLIPVGGTGIGIEGQSFLELGNMFSPIGHTHDDRYYTKTALQTGGQALIHWDNIISKPSFNTETLQSVTERGNTTNRSIFVNADIQANALFTGVSGLRFPENAFGGGGDNAGLRLVTRGGEAQSLELYTTNDGDDWINLSTPDISGVKANGHTVWHAGNDGDLLRFRSGLDNTALDNLGGQNGTYAVWYPGHSTALLNFNTPTSTGTVQLEASYEGLLRWRNKTDNNRWEPWRNILSDRDLSRIVHGENATKTSMIPGNNPNSWMASGFYNAPTETNVPYNSWWSLLHLRHSNPENNYGFQLLSNFYYENDLFYRIQNADNFTSWRRIWHSGNFDPAGLQQSTEGNWGQQSPHGFYSDFNSIDRWGGSFVTGSANGPGIPGASQYYQMKLSLGNSHLMYAMQLAVPRSPLGGNPYLSVRFLENHNWGGWSKIWAGFADNANLLQGYGPSADGAANSIALRNASGDLTAHAFYQSSLMALKKDIHDFAESGLALVNEVQIKEFVYKDDKEAHKRVGIIADSTHWHFSTKKHDRFDTNSSLAITMKAVQELSKENETLKQQNAVLREEMQAILQRMAQLEKSINENKTKE